MMNVHCSTLALAMIIVVSPSLAGEPLIEVDLTYTDVFPAATTWCPQQFVPAKTWLDVTAGDGDDTNAQLGDSAVVIADAGATTRAFLHFRVYPGPFTDTSDPFFARYGGGFTMPGGSFASARMDTAEAAGGVAPGKYATVLHEDVGGIEGDPSSKIIVDDVLTPGSLVEYFFSVDTGDGTPATTVPDTTGGHWLEFEGLPGYFDAPGTADSGVLAPCVLFVDASGAEGLPAIEEFGLNPYFGVADLSGHDRFDYQAVERSESATFARAENGDNGLGRFQSLFYTTIVYHTGSNATDGVRDIDADLLEHWLTTDDLDRDLVDVGLWMTGDNVASILSRPDRPIANAFLENILGAELVCARYCEPSCSATAEGDASSCVRIDPASAATFGSPTYSAARQDGCPSETGFDVLVPIGPGAGNLVFVDQDESGGATTEFASIVTQNEPNNYSTVLDAMSLTKLRRVASSFGGDECGQDSTAITTRFEDVFTWFGLPTGSNSCDPDIHHTCLLLVDTPELDHPLRTRLLRSHPNPFNPTTTVRYDLSEAAHALVQVFNVDGVLVRTLVDERQSARRHEVRWDGRSDDGVEVPSGVYWARLETSTGYGRATKLVVLR